MTNIKFSESKIRLRTVDEAFKEIAKMDPNNKVTKYFLKTLVKTGKIPSIKVGNKKKLINLDLLIKFLYDPTLFDDRGDRN